MGILTNMGEGGLPNSQKFCYQTSSFLVRVVRLVSVVGVDRVIRVVKVVRVIKVVVRVVGMVGVFSVVRAVRLHGPEVSSKFLKWRSLCR